MAGMDQLELAARFQAGETVDVDRGGRDATP
jgi:hypothetical protein